MSARVWAVAAMLGLALVLSSGTAGAAAGGKGKVSGVVNLNQATAEQLKLLPGVGVKAAQAIVAFRQKHPFARIEDLVKVKGFKRKRFLKLKAYLAVSGETTLKAEKPKAEEPEEKEGGQGEETASAETH